MVRKCKKCKEEKPLDKFHKTKVAKDGSQGRRWECMTCVHGRIVEMRYGLTKNQYHEMCKSQDYKCLICSKECKLYVDHCHKTGKIRGLLCNVCNLTLGRINENTDTLIKMIRYLENT